MGLGIYQVISHMPEIRRNRGSEKNDVSSEVNPETETAVHGFRAYSR